MAVALLTPVSDYGTANDNIDVRMIEVEKVTQNDWVELTYPAFWYYFKTEAGLTETATYAVGVINDGSDITAAATTITFDGATVAQWPATGTHFYMKVDNEIIEVSSYTGSVITCRRGALGTTAAIHLDNAIMFNLNSIVLASADLGRCSGMVATKTTAE